jgi:hypothetical protein
MFHSASSKSIDTMNVMVVVCANWVDRLLNFLNTNYIRVFDRV